MQPVRPQKKDSSLVEETPNFFSRIAILDLSWEKKSDIAQQIITDINDVGIAYWSQMILSVVIATFGLMINATAVVIGAMLIAPILTPIQWVAFGTTTGNQRTFLKSMRLLFLSLLIGILIAVTMTLIIPPFEITSEILSRTQPTLIDLWIALASWIVAFLSFGYKRIQASLAWVAMAAALVPPIWVVGIWIWLLSRQIARWSFLLFFTNLVAIIIMWVGILYMFGFSPNQKDDRKRSLRNMIWASGILIILCIPLATTLIDIKQGLETQKIIQYTISNYLWAQSPTTSLQSFNYEDDQLTIKLQSPPKSLLTQPQKESLSELLAETLDKELTIDVSITPVYTATPLDALQPTLAERTRTTIERFLEANYPFVEILNIDSTQWQSVLLLNLYSEDNFDTVRCRTRLQEYLKEQNLPYTTLLIEWMKSPTSTTNLDQRTRTIQGIFSESFNQNTTLQSLSIFENPTDKSLEITLWVSTSLSFSKLSREFITYQKSLETLFETSITITPKVQFFKTMEIPDEEPTSVETIVSSINKS